MVSRYVTTKVEVDAIKIESLTDDNKINELKEFIGGPIIFSADGVIISTREGDVVAKIGDYIVKGLLGEIWPIAEDIFKVKYIPAGEDASNIVPDFFCIKTAIEQIKNGKPVARRGWNGDGMFLMYNPESKLTVDRLPLVGVYKQGTEIHHNAYVTLHTADGNMSIWSPSINDVLANDYYIVDKK